MLYQVLNPTMLTALQVGLQGRSVSRAPPRPKSGQCFVACGRLGDWEFEWEIDVVGGRQDENTETINNVPPNRSSWDLFASPEDPFGLLNRMKTLIWVVTVGLIICTYGTVRDNGV